MSSSWTFDPSGQTSNETTSVEVRDVRGSYKQWNENLVTAEGGDYV